MDSGLRNRGVLMVVGVSDGLFIAIAFWDGEEIQDHQPSLHFEAEFYGQFWQSAQSSDDFLDVFEVGNSVGTSNASA